MDIKTLLTHYSLGLCSKPLTVGVPAPEATIAGVKGEILWSNYDINNLVDGGIYLAASEPVPIYE